MNKHKDIHWRVTEDYKKKLKIASILDGRNISSFLEAACNEKMLRDEERNYKISYGERLKDLDDSILINLVKNKISTLSEEKK